MLEVISKCREDGRYAELEPEGQGQSGPYGTSHGVFIPFNCLYILHQQNKYLFVMNYVMY